MENFGQFWPNSPIFMPLIRCENYIRDEVLQLEDVFILDFAV